MMQNALIQDGGPDLPDGRRMLVMTNDNDFAARGERIIR
jgi:hypothetical protein